MKSPLVRRRAVMTFSLKAMLVILLFIVLANAILFPNTGILLTVEGSIGAGTLVLEGYIRWRNTRTVQAYFNANGVA